MLNRVAVVDGVEAPENLLLDATIEEVATAVADKQAGDGHWVYELEADATIPSELILLNHYRDGTDPSLEAKLANYLCKIQGDHGGWPLFHGGDFDLSARDAILARGGAAKSNVFTRIPHAAIMPIAHFAELWTRITGGTEPFVTVDGVKMARKKMYFFSDKAMRDLGDRARPAHEAFVDAVAWFRENGYLS